MGTPAGTVSHGRGGKSLIFRLSRLGGPRRQPVLTARFTRTFLLCYKRVVVWPLRITYPDTT